MTESTKANVKVLLGLTLIHFTGDFYNSFINPLIPAFMEKYSLTLAQVGLITGISRILAFVVQPSVGYLADHYRTRFFIMGGPILSVLFVPLLGVAPSFLFLMLFICLGSIGSSMFHPSCAGMVSTYAGSHFGFSMSLFNLGGNLAFGIGPMFITLIVYRYGLEASPYTMLVGIVLVLLFFRLVPMPEAEGLANLGFFGSIRGAFGTVWKSMALIWVTMVLRAFAHQSFITFMPVQYAQTGHNLLSIGAMVSIYTVAGAFGGMLAGWSADRFGYKPVLVAAYALATPSLYLMLILPGDWIYVSSFLAGFFVLSTMPVMMAMAQELAPKAKSMVSSLMMGLAFGAGGMLSPLTGKLADIYSIHSVLLYVAILPLVTTPLIMLLPGTKEIRARVRD